MRRTRALALLCAWFAVLLPTCARTVPNEAARRVQRGFGAPTTPAGWRIVQGARPLPPPASRNGSACRGHEPPPRLAGLVIEEDVTFYVMLKQRNLDALEMKLLAGAWGYSPSARTCSVLLDCAGKQKVHAEGVDRWLTLSGG